MTQVGPGPLVDWFGHFSALAAYDVLHTLSDPIDEARRKLPMDAKQKFLWNQRLEAWKYGSGKDYVL